jgi:calcineurin-like phosphoesterase
MLSGNRSGRIPSAPRRINGRLIAHDVRDVFDQADKCLFAAETPSAVYALLGSASVVVGTHTHTSPETSTQSNAAALSPLPTGLIGKVAV